VTQTKANGGWNGRALVRAGLLAGVVIVYTAVIGMVEVFSERAIVSGVVTLDQVLIFTPALVVGFYVARRAAATSGLDRLGRGVVAGFCAALPPLALILSANLINVRAMFVNVSPAMLERLTLGQGMGLGSFYLLGALTVCGLIGALFALGPGWLQRSIVAGLAWTLGLGLLSELVIQIVRTHFGNDLVRTIFRGDALRPAAGAVVFLGATLFTALWTRYRTNIRQGYSALGTPQRRLINRTGSGVGIIILLMLPWLVGTYLSEVLSNVGLYVLMGLGLNIAIGLAGLLDLGYVTNFAVGAYVMGVLTSTGPLGMGQFNFWLILPVSLLAAMFTGFLFALPVLRMRGDYLAIATLGFGEIIRLLALSDWLKPLIGGAQGILFIPKPELSGIVGRVLIEIGYPIIEYMRYFWGITTGQGYAPNPKPEAIVFSGPQEIYYIILGACFLALFVSVRLNNSRTGRQWMAVREDEQAAAAMGIDTTLAKLLAFTISAATGGVAGAIFAVKLGTIFPHSFNLLISVNVLSLIIVGGMGSVPGVVVGAFALIGLPELLREFAEYRLLLYGVLLIVMMLARPEGLWPSAARRRELHGEAELAEPEAERESERTAAPVVAGG